MRLAVFLLAMLMLPSVTVFAAQPPGSVYLEADNSNTALILAHGRGKGPTWKVVDPLRKGVHKQLGFHTLSLQMPNENKAWPEYAADFPQAFAAIETGVRFLKQEKGVTSIYLLGHSMGSRMASAFVASNPETVIDGLIVAGCRNNGKPPLSCNDNLQQIEIPVFDIWGGKNRTDAQAAKEREALRSGSYMQTEIPAANHKFDQQEAELVAAVVAWLQRRQQSGKLPSHRLQ